MIKKILFFLLITSLFSSCFIMKKKDYYTNYKKNGRNLTKGRSSCNMFPYPIKEMRKR